MAKKSTPPTGNFRTKGQVTADKSARSAARQVTVQENVALKDNSGNPNTAKGVQYSSGFDTSKEALTAYPNAASHDPAWHDALHSHISELRKRIGSITLKGSESEESKNLGITQAVVNKTSKAKPMLDVHLDAAANELARSFAAHQDGANGGVDAYHTAHTAYVNAHKHVTDVHRLLVGTGLDSAVGNPALGSSDRLLGTTGRKNLIEGYTAHLKDSAGKKGIRLQKNVLSKETPDLSPTGEGFSDVGQKELNRRGMPATPEEETGRKEAAQSLKMQTSQRKFREAAMSGKYTPTLQEMQRNQAGEPPVSKRSAYAGVGITGFNDIATAAKAHYETTNPDESWHDSEHSKGHDLNAIAKAHYETVNEGKSWRGNAIRGRKYVQENLPHLLKPENHPTIQYALKNKIGVFKKPEDNMRTTLNLMGERLASRTGQIAAGKIATSESDPTNTGTQKADLQAAQERLGSAPAVTAPTAPRRRNAEFGTGATK